MLKFLKMTVAEDVTTTEEVLAVLAEEALLQGEKAILPLEEKAVLEATEVQLPEKVVLEEEDPEKAVHQTEPQDVLKALVIHQDQEDQEETNTYC